MTIEELREENNRLLLMIEKKDKIINVLLKQSKEIKKQNESLRNLRLIEERHRKLNGKLRVENKELKAELKRRK